MFSADSYVKPFIDGNWLSIGIMLIILRGVARSFKLTPLRKIYYILNSALEFIRPRSSDVTEYDKTNNKT